MKKAPNLSLDKIFTLNKKAYDSLAHKYNEQYSDRFNHNNWLVQQYVLNLKAITKKENPSVLDIGCAVGLDAYALLQEGCKVLGIDISPEMIVFAKQNAPNAKFEVDNFIEHEFSQTFDGIYSQNFIHLFPKETAIQMINKMGSLLNPGGLIHITTSDEGDKGEGLFDKAEYKGNIQRYRKFWSYEELLEVILKLNFKIINTFYTLPFGKNPWMIIEFTNGT